MKKLVLALCVCGVIGCENKPQVKPQPQPIQIQQQSKVDPKEEEFVAFEPTDIARSREKIIEHQMMKDEFKKRDEAIKAKYEKK